jgi:hypothetical protein
MLTSGTQMPAKNTARRGVGAADDHTEDESFFRIFPMILTFGKHFTLERSY